MKTGINAMSTCTGLADGSGSFFSAISQLIIANYLDQMFLIYGSNLSISLFKYF